MVLTQVLEVKGISLTSNDCFLGMNMLMVGMIGPVHPCEQVCVRHQGNNKYTVSYLVKDTGNYVLVVKWGDEHIPGSPFRVAVK